MRRTLRIVYLSLRSVTRAPLRRATVRKRSRRAAITRGVAAVLGLAATALGAWMLAAEVRLGGASRDEYVRVAVGLMVLGLFLVLPTLMTRLVRQVVVVVAPLLPAGRLVERRRTPRQNDSDTDRA